MSRLDVLLKGIYQILIGGSPLPREPGLDLVAGSNVTITSVDDPTNGISHVTIASSGGSSSTPTPILYLTAAATVTISGAVQVVGVDTSAAGTYAVTLPAMTDGQVVQIDDHNGTWVVSGAPTIVPPTSVWIENPQGSAVVLGPSALTLPAVAGVPRSSYRFTYYANATTHPTLKVS
jgi:hypothetical protein